jgi:hypothetical protein
VVGGDRVRVPLHTVQYIPKSSTDLTIGRKDSPLIAAPVSVYAPFSRARCCLTATGGSTRRSPQSTFAHATDLREMSHHPLN